MMMTLALVLTMALSTQARPDFSGQWTTAPEAPAAGAGGQGRGPGGAPGRGRGDMGSGWGPTIRITQHNVYLELLDRIPILGKTDQGKRTAVLMAEDIFQAWLDVDPDRTLEISGDGLRGLIPESILNDRLNLYYRTGDPTVVGPFRKSDRGPRHNRPTARLEFDIEEASGVHRSAA